MKVWKKQTTRVKDGKKEKVFSSRFYGTLKTCDGKKKQTPLLEDKEASETLLRRLQSEQDQYRAIGLSRSEVEAKRPLKELLKEYRQYLEAKGNTAKYVDTCLNRIQAVVGATKAKALNDLESTLISSTLRRWTEKPKQVISLSTVNHYITALKSFSRWLWIERKSPEDILRNLRKVNAKTDIKRVRRAFTSEELRLLVETTQQSRRKLRGLTPSDRAILYLLAAYTGLRASELGSLTVDSIDLEAKTITVKAAYSKRRREDVLPLHGSLLKPLEDFLLGKKGQLFKGTWNDHNSANTIKMFRYDLKQASIPYVDKAGKYADFHSLRHTYITLLARSGVSPAKAKELARHSTIRLTIDHYTHCDREELRESLDTIPSLPMGDNV